MGAAGFRASEDLGGRGGAESWDLQKHKGSIRGTCSTMSSLNSLDLQFH